jgi:predicted DNA-binding transcriptional regulator YafY
MGLSAAEQVLGLLGDGQVWSGERLADRSGLSLRTVRRAVATLREHGVVIDTDVGRGGGMRLGSRSALPPVRLAHDEALSLLFALALAESLQLPMLSGPLRQLRAKLSVSFVPLERGNIQRLRTRMLVGQPASEAVRTSWISPQPGQSRVLQDAFITSRVVEFQYRARDGRSSLRCVEPHYLLLNHPVWYLLGLDRGLLAGRTFRLDGM